MSSLKSISSRPSAPDGGLVALLTARTVLHLTVPRAGLTDVTRLARSPALPRDPRIHRPSVEAEVDGLVAVESGAEHLRILRGATTQSENLPPENATCQAQDTKRESLIRSWKSLSQGRNHEDGRWGTPLFRVSI